MFFIADDVEVFILVFECDRAVWDRRAAGGVVVDAITFLIKHESA